MTQPAFNKPQTNHSSGCTDLMTMAQKELKAFFYAVMQSYGSEQARLSAEDWLSELEAMDPLPTSIRELRRITIDVASRLASRLNLTTVGELV